jgi:hypothetical protein
MPTRAQSPFYSVLMATQPAAGAELEIKATGQGLWRIPSLRARFVADANVANRTVVLTADDGTDEVWRVAYNAVVAAGGDVVLCAYSGAIQSTVSAGTATVPLPTDGLILLPGWRLRTSTGSIQVGDQYSDIQALIHEYPFGALEEWLPGVAAQQSTME